MVRQLSRIWAKQFWILLHRLKTSFELNTWEDYVTPHHCPCGHVKMVKYCTTMSQSITLSCTHNTHRASPSSVTHFPSVPLKFLLTQSFVTSGQHISSPDVRFPLPNKNTTRLMWTHQFVWDPPDLWDFVRAECERYLSEVVIHVVVAVQLYDQDQLPAGGNRERATVRHETWL